MEIATELSSHGFAGPIRPRKRSASSPPEISFASSPAQRPKHTDAITTSASHLQTQSSTKALSYLSYLDLAKDPVAPTAEGTKYFAQQRDIVGAQRRQQISAAYTTAKTLADHGQGTPEQVNTIMTALSKPVTEHTQELAGRTATNLGVALWRNRIPHEYSDTSANILAKIAHPATPGHTPAWQAEVTERLGSALWWHAHGLTSTTKNRLVDTVFQRAKGPWKSPTKQSEVLQFPALAAIESGHTPEFNEHVATQSIQTLQSLMQDSTETAAKARLAIANGLGKMLTRGAVLSPALQEKATDILWDLSTHPANTAEDAKAYQNLAMHSTYATSKPIQQFIKNETDLLDLIKSAVQNQRIQDSFLHRHPTAKLETLASLAMINVERISADYRRAAADAEQLRINYEAASRNGTLYGLGGLETANTCEDAIRHNKTVQAQRLTDIALYRGFAQRVNPEFVQQQ